MGLKFFPIRRDAEAQPARAHPRVIDFGRAMPPQAVPPHTPGVEEPERAPAHPPSPGPKPPGEVPKAAAVAPSSVIERAPAQAMPLIPMDDADEVVHSLAPSDGVWVSPHAQSRVAHALDTARAQAEPAPRSRSTEMPVSQHGLGGAAHDGADGDGVGAGEVGEVGEVGEWGRAASPEGAPAQVVTRHWSSPDIQGTAAQAAVGAGAGHAPAASLAAQTAAAASPRAAQPPKTLMPRDRAAPEAVTPAAPVVTKAAPPRAATVVPTEARAGAAGLTQAVALPESEQRMAAALVAEGVPQRYVDIAIARQRVTQESLLKIMTTREYGFATAEQLARVLAVTSGKQYFSPTELDRIDGQGIRSRLQRSNMRLHAQEVSLPVAWDDDGVSLICASPDLEPKGRMAWLDVGHIKQVHIASTQTMQSVYRRYFSDSAQEVREAYKRLAQGIAKSALDADDKDIGLRRFLLTVLRHGCYAGASDIAFTPMASNSGGTLRYKMLGEGDIFAYLDKPVWTRVVNYLAQQASATETLNTEPKEWKFEFHDEDNIEFGEIRARYEFRTELIQRKPNDSNALTVVMRILDQQNEATELDQLGFDDFTLSRLRTYASRKTGLFLVCGPTGSGKSTTLQAILSLVNPVSRWISTIENPIEFPRGMWSQYQIPPQASGEGEGDGANTILQGLLRAAPDVILFAEIRGAAVAAELVDAGNTGHLVFTTVHTNSAALAVSRLVHSFKVDPGALASLLLGILAQRLVRTLCACAQPDQSITTAQVLKSLARMEGAEMDGEDVKPLRAVGCPNCNWTGYRGRRMVYELLEVNRQVEQAIERGAPVSEVQEAGIPAGKRMYAHALKLVAQGVTSLDEAEKLNNMRD